MGIYISECYQLKAVKILGLGPHLSLYLLVTTVLKCFPSYPDSHVLNQSSVVIVTADCAGPAAPVSLCVPPRPSAYMRSNWAEFLLGKPVSNPS